jgi:hypothetical protein
MSLRTGGTHDLVSQTPESAATGGADASDGVTSDVPANPDVREATAGDGTTDDTTDRTAGTTTDADDLTSRHDERHDGSSFEPVPRDPGATTRPYPPEADPEPDVVVPEAVVPGEQTDPARRTEVFPEDEGTATAGTTTDAAPASMPRGTEPPD